MKIQYDYFPHQDVHRTHVKMEPPVRLSRMALDISVIARKDSWELCARLVSQKNFLISHLLIIHQSWECMLACFMSFSYFYLRNQALVLLEVAYKNRQNYPMDGVLWEDMSAIQSKNVVCAFMKHGRYFHLTCNFTPIQL